MCMLTWLNTTYRLNEAFEAKYGILVVALSRLAQKERISYFSCLINCNYNLCGVKACFFTVFDQDQQTNFSPLSELIFFHTDGKFR